MVSKVDPYDQGGYTEIFSNAGVVVAHPDKPQLGKDLAETLAYEMLTSDRAKAGDALRYANDCIATLPVPDAADEEARTVYDGALRFVAGLQAYAESAGAGELDPAGMTPALAQAMLQADPVRLRQAEEIRTAVKDGEMHISTDESFHTVYMPIRFSEVTNPLSVAVSIPMTKILDNANDIRNYVILVSAMAICLIALLLYIIARNITKPILVLSESAKLLGEGNFDAEIPPAESNDEIGALSRAF